MRVLLQRVNHAKVSVEGKTVGSINQGLLLLVGLGAGDAEANFKAAAEKICDLRIFAGPKGKFDLSLKDVSGQVLVVPQFTLYAETSKGRRPEFFGALAPELARPAFERLVQVFRDAGVSRVETGVFGAYMQVELENDGPVTVLLEW